MPNDPQAAPHHAISRHILWLLAHSAKFPSCRARRRTPHLKRHPLTAPTGSVSTIETGSDFQIGPSVISTTDHSLRPITSTGRNPKMGYGPTIAAPYMRRND